MSKTLSGDLCRCCLSEGSFKNLGIIYINPDGEEEVYSEMLLQSFDITIKPLKGCFAEMTYKICEPCILSIREATRFKRLITLSEKRFEEMIAEYDLICDDDHHEEQETVEVKEEKPIEITIESIKQENEDDEAAFPNSDMFYGDDFYNSDDDVSLSKVSKEKPLLLRPITGSKRSKTQTKTPKKRKAAPKKKSTPKKSKTTENTETTTSEQSTSTTKQSALPQFWLKETDFKQENDKFTCIRCEKIFTKKSYLQNHVKSVHFKRECTFCGSSYNNYADYVQHSLERHGVELRHPCLCCEKKFLRKFLLTKHMQTFHMLGEKIKCDFCDYETFSKINLRRHQIVHMKERKFKCRYCEKRFYRKTNVQAHEAIHTGKRSKVCDVCGAAFVQRASLKYHMEKKHPNHL